MSPTTKKILMIGGAVVAGFVAYRVIRKPSAAATVALPAQKAAALQKAALLSKFASAQITKIGTSEDLGTLGSSWR